MDSDRAWRILRELRRALGVMERILERPVEEFLEDDEAVYALRYAVVEFVEAAAQLGIVLTRRQGARPGSYGEVFEMLGDLNIIPRELALEMRRLVSLRNLIVHRYWEVDDRRIYSELKASGLALLRRFVEAAEGYVDKVV